MIEVNGVLIPLLPANSYNASTNGTGVDILDYTGNMMVILDATKISGTDPTLDVKIQESADNSTWSDISGAEFTQVTTASLEKITLNADGLKRYIRAVATLGGTSPVFAISCNAVGIKQRMSQ